MAGADLLAGVLSMPLSATVDLLIVRQASLEHVCVLNNFNIDLMHCFLWSSLYHLTVTAWEKYVAIRKWMDCKVIVTKNHLKMFEIIAWLLAIFTKAPVLIMEVVGVDFVVVRNWITFGIVSGAVALILIVYSYVMMYLEVRKRKTSEIRQVTALVQAKLEAKVAKTTGMLTAAVILTFVLSTVFFRLEVSFLAFHLKLAFRISETLLQLHSAMNPLLYC